MRQVSFDRIIEEALLYKERSKKEKYHGRVEDT